MTGLKNTWQTLMLKIINWLVFWPQYWYMKPKIGDGWVNIKMAFFHPKK